MKQLRLDFSGGVNVIADKSVLPDKFGTVMDNIDLRSGFPRCFKEPIFNQIVANADTTKIFNFRGRWVYSENWRDYVADYINGIERIYWTESINGVQYNGSSDLKPQKMVEGTTVQLGTDRPTTSLIISSGKNIVPSVDKPTASNSGGLSQGTYYYAVSAEFSKGIGAPSDIVNIVISQNNTANITLKWSAVENAIGYIIWGRSSSYSEMKRIQRVISGVTTWVDIGAVTPKGDSPNEYFDNLPVSYVYTYERNVNGVVDESGLSDVSDRINTNLTRNIARDFLNDGYFSQSTAVDISTDDGYTFTVDPRPSTANTFPYYVNIEVTGTEFDRQQNQVIFTTSSAHKLTTDDEIVFTGSAWQNPAYNNQRYPVIVLNTTQFAIKNIPSPTDQIYGGIENNGYSFTPTGGGIQSSNLFNVYSETGQGTGAVFDVTFTPSSGAGPALEVVDTVSVHTAGTGYGVGDIVYIELDPFPYQGQPSPVGIELGSTEDPTPPVSISTVGSGYPKPNSIKTLWINNGGSGYTAGTYTGVALTGGSGSGATIDLKVNADGLIYDVTINNSGINYIVGDVLSAVVTGGSGVSFYVFETNSGTYYDVEITGGTGVGAAATVTVNASGQIAAVDITEGGTGYTGGGTVGLGGGISTTGTPAQLNILLTQTDYVRQYFTITDVNGNGDVSICRSRITISPVPAGGTINNGDAMYLNMSDSAEGRIYRVIFAGGNGYKDGLYQNVPLTAVSGFGNGATANITVTNGVVTGVDIENQGYNYAVDNVLNIAASSLNSNNSIKTKSLTGAGSGYAGGGSQTFSNVPLTGGSGSGAIAQITVVSGIVTVVNITNGGSGYAVNNVLSASNTNLGGSGTGFQVTVNSVYLGAGANVTVTSIEDAEVINGMYRVYTTDLDGNPIPEGSFDINEYIGTWKSPTELGASARWVPFNGYYKYWNLYRTGSSGAFQLVDKIDIFTSNFTDTISTQYLGTTPTSYYTETGIFGPVQVDFMPPPLGLQSLTSHYGMLFGVDGQRVKWTPIGQPDAWPDTYYYDFTYKPLALASFGTGIIVLCEDAIYRIDGNSPSSMSLSKTQANEGCIAPYTVQKTNKGLAYLSKRGVMLFDGMNAECITDNRIPSNMLLGPSKLQNPVNFWWIPTKLGYFYGNFAFNDGVYYPDESANRFYQTNPIPAAIYDIKSFYHNGRYFLVYTKSDYYSAHTTLCIDLQVEGFPITTLGLKPIDIVVNELDDVYALFQNQGNGDMANLSTFKGENYESEPFVPSETYIIPTSPYQVTVVNASTFVENISVYNSTDSLYMTQVSSSPAANEYTVSAGVYTFGSTNAGKQIVIKYRFGFATNAGLSVWKLFAGKSNMPLVIRSGQKGFGNTTERRKYEHLEFYGNGTLYTRCYIDSSWIADDIVTLTEVPTKARKFNLPKGKRIGYNLDFEAYGDTNRLVVEYGYTDMESPS